MIGPAEYFWITYGLLSAWFWTLCGVAFKYFVFATPYIFPFVLLAWLIGVVATAFARGEA